MEELKSRGGGLAAYTGMHRTLKCLSGSAQEGTEAEPSQREK